MHAASIGQSRSLTHGLVQKPPGNSALSGTHLSTQSALNLHEAPRAGLMPSLPPHAAIARTTRANVRKLITILLPGFRGRSPKMRSGPFGPPRRLAILGCYCRMSCEASIMWPNWSRTITLRIAVRVRHDAHTKLAHVQLVSPSWQALPSGLVQLRPVYTDEQSARPRQFVESLTCVQPGLRSHAP